MIDYFHANNVDWNTYKEKSIIAYEDVINVFTVRNENKEHIFRLLNLVESKMYSFHIEPYIKPTQTVSSINAEYEEVMINTAIDLSNSSVNKNVSNKIETFKDDAESSNCEALTWHTSDKNRIMFFNYYRDKESASKFKLMNITIWNNKLYVEKQKEIELSLLKKKFSQEERVKTATLNEIIINTEDTSDAHITYSVNSNLQYRKIRRWLSFSDYICLDNIVVDPKLFQIGYLNDDNTSIKVLIPNYFSNYNLIEGSKYRFILTYCREANVYVVRTVNKNIEVVYFHNGTFEN